VGSGRAISKATQALPLILARNLIEGLDLAAFLIDPDAVIVFFNDAAGELVGRRFEEVGPLTRDEWASRYGPYDELGELVPTDDLPLTVALREGHPAHGHVHLRLQDGELVPIDVSALPLSGAEGFMGTLVVCWRSADGLDG
jgi:PAS domain-containing protein